jgi:hypothetical protein
MRMRHVVICDLCGCIIFFHIISWTAFFRKKLMNVKCVFCFSLQLISETFLILRRTARDMIKKICTGLHVKYPLFLSGFNETWIFLTDSRKILRYKISWKSIQCEVSCSLRMDEQADMTKLIIYFRSLVNAHKNSNQLYSPAHALLRVIWTSPEHLQCDCLGVSTAFWNSLKNCLENTNIMVMNI